MYYVCLSPLAKIFQPEFTVVIPGEKGEPATYETVTRAMLLKNPDRIHKKEQFSIKVERSVGTLIFKHGIPRVIVDPNIANWISGGPDGKRMQETDCYGIVKLPLTVEIEGAVGYFVNKGQQPPNELQQAFDEAQRTAEEMSNERVMGAIRMIHSSVKEQMRLNKEAGLGMPEPSAVEFLCAYVLAAEEAKSSKERKKVTDKFTEMMNQSYFG